MKGWGVEHVYYLPTLEDFAELASLAGDRGLLMNPPDQWADPPDSDPVMSAATASRHARWAEEDRVRAEAAEAHAAGAWSASTQAEGIREYWRERRRGPEHPTTQDDEPADVPGTLTVWKTGWSWTRAK